MPSPTRVPWRAGSKTPVATSTMPQTISAIDEGPDVDLPRPVPPPKPRDQRAERRTSASTARAWWRVPSSDVRAVRP